MSAEPEIMQDHDELKMFVHNNSVLATLLDISGFPIAAVSNEYNYADLKERGITATAMKDRGKPGAVAYGHMRTPGIENVINAFDLQKRHIAQARNIEITVTPQDAARLIAFFADRQKSVNKLWRLAAPTIRRDTGPKSFAVYSTNLSPEHMLHLELSQPNE